MNHYRQSSKYDVNDNNIFFSLVNYRNEFFSSKDPLKIIEFFDSFENKYSLINWMKERPHGACKIHEVNGDKDIIAIILTADYSGKYSWACRNEVFHGIHMIFVESGEAPDPYFNISHNKNEGLKLALQYNPKWIIISNDDVFKVEDIKILKKELLTFDSNKYDVIRITEGKYHSRNFYIGLTTKLYSLYIFLTRNNISKQLLRLQKKFDVRYNMGDWKAKYLRVLKKTIRYVDDTNFYILSGQYVEKQNGQIFDEVFINHREDTDFSLQIKYTNLNDGIARFQIGDLIGSTLGTGPDREMRKLASDIYFNYKWSSFLEKQQSKDLTE